MASGNHQNGFALAEPAVAAGFKLATFETLGSTNDAAFALAEEGAQRTWVVARAQTAGRGRHGRLWQSPAGNLFASLVLVDATAMARAPQLGFVAGVALARALRRLVSDPSLIRIKWPNDILFDDAKLAGILVEGRVLTSGAYAVVMGLGVNCRVFPTDIPYRATSLADAGAARHEAEDAFRLLSEEMAYWLPVFQQGFDAIRTEWLTLAPAIGTPMKVNTTSRQFEGIFQSIDASGRLLLSEAGQIYAIEAGDVLLGH